MPHPLHTRPATIADAAGIARVRVRSWQAGYRCIVPSDVLEAMSVEANEERVRSWDWSTETAQSWVCLRDGETVGWPSALCPARGEDLPESAGEIAACYALPGVWGLGVGHQMMDAATAWLRARGARVIVLWVLEQNARAQGFYLRQGFSLDGHRKEESMLAGSGLVSVRMWRGVRDGRTTPPERWLVETELGWRCPAIKRVGRIGGQSPDENPPCPPTSVRSPAGGSFKATRPTTTSRVRWRR